MVTAVLNNRMFPSCNSGISPLKSASLAPPIKFSGQRWTVTEDFNPDDLSLIVQTHQIRAQPSGRDGTTRLFQVYKTTSIGEYD